MSYYPYSKNPTYVEVLLILIEFFFVGLICAFVSTFRNEHSTTAAIIIGVVLLGLIVAGYFYRKTRLYGVYLYEDSVEIDRFKRLGIIRLSEITDYSLLGDARNESSIWFYFARGRASFIPATLGRIIRLFKSKKGYYTGGYAKDCIRLVVNRKTTEYIIVFSLEDNAAFLNELSLRKAEGKEK